MRSLQQASRAHEDRAADPTNDRRELLQGRSGYARTRPRAPWVRPTVGHGLLAAANVTVLVVLVLLLQGWSPGRGLGLRVLRP
jgi:hypothetical protein